jgi:hypothetical protein
VTGGQGCGFLEEEAFGPAAGAHDPMSRGIGVQIFHAGSQPDLQT